MKMSLIPREHVPKIWDKVSGFLDSSSDSVRQRYDIVDMFEACLTGHLVLWVVFDEESDNEIMAAMTTNVIRYPRFTALGVTHMGGDGVTKFQDLVMDTLSKYARDSGFTSIEISGRDGWERICKKYGFEKTMTVIELDLTKVEAIAAE